MRKAIDEWEGGDLDCAMLHACIAVDATARETHPSLGNRARFTQLLRENYAIVGPMGAPGINLEETRFPVTLKSRPTTDDELPDLADVIYAVHRCSHAHGDALPDGFELLNDAEGPPRRTRMIIQNGKLLPAGCCAWAPCAQSPARDIKRPAPTYSYCPSIRSRRLSRHPASARSPTSAACPVVRFCDVRRSLPFARSVSARCSATSINS